MSEQEQVEQKIEAQPEVVEAKAEVAVEAPIEAPVEEAKEEALVAEEKSEAQKFIEAILFTLEKHPELIERLKKLLA